MLILVMRKRWDESLTNVMLPNAISCTNSSAKSGSVSLLVTSSVTPIDISRSISIYV